MLVRPVLSTIQITIAQIEQLLNSPIQFIDMMKLINLIRNLQIEVIQVQFGGEVELPFKAGRGGGANSVNRPKFARVCSGRIPVPRQLNAIINVLIQLHFNQLNYV